MADLIGHKLGDYELRALLGRGGMASVYRARQQKMNRDIAIKVIESSLAHDVAFVKRFEREAQLIASLSHPHILKVFDFGEQDGLLYLVMELITGGSLHEQVQTGALPMPRTERLLEQIASALDYAHGRGIVHRDLKPPNVLLDEQGNAVLTDFGIAKLLQSDQGALTQTGVLVGTPAYMPPEQWQGQNVDSRADIYALGVMLYEMLTGARPFSGETPTNLMYAHFEAQPEPLRVRRPDLPDSVEWVIAKALAKRRGDRFQTAGDLAKAFRMALSGGVVVDPDAAVDLIPLDDEQATEISSGRQRDLPDPTQAAPGKPTNAVPSTNVAAQTPIIPEPRQRLSLPLLLMAALLMVGLIAAMVFVANQSNQLSAQASATAIMNTLSPALTGTAAALLATPTPTLTPTFTPTPTLTFTPSQTPMAGPTAVVSSADGELLVLIADFRTIGSSDLDPDEEWEITLTEAIDRLRRDQRRRFQPRVLRVPVQVEDAESARQLSDQYRATLVIWGRVRAAAVESFYTVTPRWGTLETEIIGETRVQAQATLDELRIFVSGGGDTEYKLNFILAQLAYFGEKPEDAIPFLTRCIALAPPGREAEVGLAAVFFYRGYLYDVVKADPVTAISDYTRAIELDPTLAVAYQNRGNNYDQVGEFDKALADFNRAIDLKPDNALYYFNRAEHFKLTQQPQDALKDYGTTIRLEPGFAGAYSGRGVLYVALGRLEEAIADFSKAIEIAPDVADFHFNLGLAYGGQGDMPRTLQSLSRAIELDPTFTRAYVVRGGTYRRINELDRALADLNRAIALDPVNADAHNERGLVYQFQGKNDQAIADFTRAIALNPKAALAYTNRAFLYMITGKFDESIADYQAAIALEPNNPALYAGLGTVYDLMKNAPEALAAYRKHVELAGAQAQPFVVQRVNDLTATLTPPAPTSSPRP